MSDELVAEYLNFRYGMEFNKNLVTKLLKFIQPALVYDNQHSLFQDPSALGQFASDPIIKLVSSSNTSNAAEVLVNRTALKLQLVTKKDSNLKFTQLNINAISDNFERLNMLLAGLHSSSQHKHEALDHIKDLIADANFVKVTDRYLCEDSNWQQCKQVLQHILPKTQSIPLKIVTVKFNRHKELTKIFADWKVSGEQIGQNVHDRYIETNKLKIMLSSGIYHLSTDSSTDLTYVVKIKND